MNILFIVAQLVSHRSALLRSLQPMQLLRNFPPLQENEIIKLSLSFIPELPKKLYELIVRYGHDRAVPNELKTFLIEDKI